MKKFYEKLRKYVDVESSRFQFKETNKAHAFAKILSKATPNCDIHIRRGHVVVIHANCIADTWLLAAYIVACESPYRHNDEVRSKMEEIIRYARYCIKKRIRMDVNLNGQVISSLNFLQHTAAVSNPIFYRHE